MYSENDKCYHCQEPGHMACHCPDKRCFNCEEYSHVAADCPIRIPPSGTPAHHRRHHSSSTKHWTRPTSKHCHRDRHRFSRSQSQSCSHKYRSHSHNNYQRSHSRSYDRHPHRSTSHHHSSTYCYWHDTLNNRSLPYRSSSTHSPDCSSSRSKSHTSYKPSRAASSRPPANPHTSSRHHDRKYK